MTQRNTTRKTRQKRHDSKRVDRAPRRWEIKQGRHRITSEMSADEVRQVLRRARPRLSGERGDE